ncbi:MAG: hypothetical protein CVV44_08480 [Spirochaetae bacterium HGW-Spirochaetae-1]|jgi:hypothetical protein|nr:MAG: hypothetical protein CVV44_08480 [Spirochaetae bacterium HGW-Spirochaetae-1]
MELFGIIIIFLIIFIALAIRENSKSKNNHFPGINYAGPQYLIEAGKSLGCRMNATGTYGTGTLDGVTFSLKTFVGQNEQLGTEVFINHTLPVRGLSNITKENMLSRIKKDFGKDDVVIGDGFFDDKMLIKTQNSCGLAALLNHNTRKRIQRLYEISASFEISNSWIRTNLRFNDNSKQAIIDLVKAAVAVSASLVRESDTRQMLMDNIFSDPEPGVRLNNLELLASNFPSSPELMQVYEDALADPSLNVQVAAASLLGEKGMSHLLELAKNGNPEKLLLLKIIRLLGEHRHLAGKNFLLDLFTRTGNREIKIAILHACEGMASEELIPFLAGMLEEKDHTILAPVIGALGTCGNLDIMERLYTLYKNSLHPGIREEASRAMSKIQGRFGVERGWLSVAELAGTEGGLSLADEAGEGSLSLTEEKESEE